MCSILLVFDQIFKMSWKNTDINELTILIILENPSL